MAQYEGKYGTYYAANATLEKSEREANARYIHAAFTEAGWTLNAICGILGNMQHESGPNPGRWQGGNVKDSSGYGLVQWTPSTNFLGWAKAQSPPEDELMDGQIAKILHELETTTTSEKDVQYFEKPEYPLSFTEFTQSTKSAKYLAKVFGVNYERSGAILAGGQDKEDSLNARAEKAAAWWILFGGSESDLGDDSISETNYTEFAEKETWVVNAPKSPLNVRTGAGTGYEDIGDLADGVSVVVLGLDKDWAKIEWGDGTAWCSAKYLKKYDEQSETVDEQTETEGDNVSNANTISAKALIAEFYKMLGWKYEWGAARTGVVDCSGAFAYAFKQLGSWMYHGSNTMWSKYTYDKGKFGTVELLPGMAVYKWKSPDDFHHVGLYIGAGLVIEAKGAKYGVVVSRVEDWHYAGKLKSKDGTVVNYDVAEFTPESCVGVVNVNGTLNMRSATETVSSNIITKISNGTSVDVLDIEVDAGWYAIRYNGKLGFVMQNYISMGESDTQENPTEETDDADSTEDADDTNDTNQDIRRVVSQKTPLNVRTGAGLNYEDIGDLPYDATVVVVEEKGTWAKIEWEGGTAWCSSKYLEKIKN